jgi:hypothetical protein
MTAWGSVAHKMDCSMRLFAVVLPAVSVFELLKGHWAEGLTDVWEHGCIQDPR